MNGDSPGFMGNPYGATPNLDKFAAGAVRFERCHVTAPICQPSRSALMTGRVPHRNGALGFNPIRTDVPTLVEIFESRLLYRRDPQAGADGPEERSSRGTCRSKARPRIRPRSGSMSRNVLRPPKRRASRSSSTPTRATRTGPSPAATRRTPRASAGSKPHRVYTADQIKAPSFLEDVPDIRREVAQYYTGVARFDRCFGETISALKDAGHADDTLIVFLSDHGMSFPFSKATVYFNGTWSPVLFERRQPQAAG